MQNKANFQNDKMNVSTVISTYYKQKTINYANKNKAKTKPIKPNLLEIPMNVSSVKSVAYKNEPPFLAQKSQSQFSKQPKMNINYYYTKVYEPRTMNYELKNKPKRTQNKSNQSQFCLADLSGRRLCRSIKIFISLRQDIIMNFNSLP